MASELTSPVPFSTPDNHILTETEPVVVQGTGSAKLTDDEFSIQYEIRRTLDEIHKNKWNKIALQFPDDMLGDSARVYQMLARGYTQAVPIKKDDPLHPESSGIVSDNTSPLDRDLSTLSIQNESQDFSPLKLTILADTSYGSCCVDEIAAEHVDADVVVHYGRTCLSPTSRLPVLYVYTKCALDHEEALRTFADTFTDKTEKVIVMADIPYSHHVNDICETLKFKQGYDNLHAAEIVRDMGGLIPNRTLPQDIATVKDEDAANERLRDWSIFHISDPPTALLLTLESRVKAVHMLPTKSQAGTSGRNATQSNTAQVLRRRYALITSLNTVSTWGILINTLSVKNYLHIVDHVKQQIANAGKKSYLFVVGKINPAKVANFAEIGGWIVIGCWESSLIDSRDFYRPIITPYELELVLQPDEERVWTGAWRSDFQGVLDQAERKPAPSGATQYNSMPGAFVDDEDEDEQSDVHDSGSDEESAPPEFDLRTGKYISRTRPMGNSQSNRSIKHGNTSTTSTALAKRANGDIRVVNGVASPAAEYLAERRTWRGLGSDFEVKYDDEEEQGSLIEEGRTGVARGYTTGDSDRK